MIERREKRETERHMRQRTDQRKEEKITRDHWTDMQGEGGRMNLQEEKEIRRKKRKKKR